MGVRRILAYGLTATLAAIALAALSPSPAVFLDLRITDAIVRASGSRAPSKTVAIVAIDDASLAEIGQWPWPRDVVARLIDGIRRLGARVVAVDVLLAEPDRFAPPGSGAVTGTDAALAKAVADGVVISYALTFGAGDAIDRRCVLHPLGAAVVERRGVGSPVDHLFHATGVVCSLPVLGRSAGSSGFLNASPDRDGLLRRVPLLMEFAGDLYPSLALAAVTRARSTRRVRLEGLAAGRARLVLEDAGVPLDAGGTLLVRFRGARGAFGYVPAADVLKGRVPDVGLGDRIVFVGVTALGVQDVVSTPADTMMPGIAVHAAAADTLLQGDFVSSPPWSRAYELGATAAIGIVVVAVLATTGFLYGTIASVALLVALWAAAFAGVSARGLYLSPVYPTLALVLVVSALTVGKLRHERGRADAERTRRERAHHFVVQSLTSLMESRDGATGQHARRTQAYSRLLATRLAALPRFRDDLTPERVQLIAELSPLHDIGKVGVRDAVLYKPGALSGGELDEIRRHPAFGHDTIASAARRAGVEGNEVLLQLAKDIVYTHHERWDGRGYPRGLAGEGIPLAGRIMALVDVYDALCNSRTYRQSLTHEEAVATIAAGRGTQFDPDIVDAFLAVSDEFRRLSLAMRDGV